MFPLRWRSDEGSPYTAWSVARNERRALPKILVVYVTHSCYDDRSLLELGIRKATVGNGKSPNERRRASYLSGISR